ncbi:MAG: hypothetical protein HN894_15550 [Bacteroidetes bacterium]|jgi:hypothetical protein|nr:hypothetical protein [Bacteroidota bacterium]
MELKIEYKNKIVGDFNYLMEKTIEYEKTKIQVADVIKYYKRKRMYKIYIPSVAASIIIIFSLYFSFINQKTEPQIADIQQIEINKKSNTTNNNENISQAKKTNKSKVIEKENFANLSKAKNKESLSEPQLLKREVKANFNRFEEIEIIEPINNQKFHKSDSLILKWKTEKTSSGIVKIYDNNKKLVYHAKVDLNKKQHFVEKKLKSCNYFWQISTCNMRGRFIVE